MSEKQGLFTTIGAFTLAKIEVKGLTEYQSLMNELDNSIEGILKMGVYDGAGIMADAIRKELDAELTGRNQWEEKQIKGLKDGFGISKMTNTNGFISVNMGFSGYNEVKTEQYPKGQPNIMIASSIANGTSWGYKRPFIRNAILKAKNKAIQKTQQTIKDEVQKLQK